MTEFTREEMHNLRSVVGTIEMALELIKTTARPSDKKMLDLLERNVEKLRAMLKSETTDGDGK